MKRPILVVLLGAIVALGFTACAGRRAARISENQGLFSALSPTDQQKVRQGLIDIGYRSELVYMALGRPSRVLRDPDPARDVQTWVYHNFYAPTSALTIFPPEPPAPSGGGRTAGASVSAGVVSTSRSGPKTGGGGSPSATATLLVDLAGDVVVRMRLEP